MVTKSWREGNVYCPLSFLDSQWLLPSLFLPPPSLLSPLYINCIDKKTRYPTSINAAVLVYGTHELDDDEKQKYNLGR